MTNHSHLSAPLQNPRGDRLGLRRVLHSRPGRPGGQRAELPGQGDPFRNPVRGANDSSSARDTIGVSISPSDGCQNAPAAALACSAAADWALLPGRGGELNSSFAPQRWLAPGGPRLLAAMIQHANCRPKDHRRRRGQGFAFVLMFLALEALLATAGTRACFWLGAAPRSTSSSAAGDVAAAIAWGLGRWEGRIAEVTGGTGTADEPAVAPKEA